MAMHRSVRSHSEAEVIAGGIAYSCGLVDLNHTRRATEGRGIHLDIAP